MVIILNFDGCFLYNFSRIGYSFCIKYLHDLHHYAVKNRPRYLTFSYLIPVTEEF